MLKSGSLKSCCCFPQGNILLRRGNLPALPGKFMVSKSAVMLLGNLPAPPKMHQKGPAVCKTRTAGPFMPHLYGGRDRGEKTGFRERRHAGDL
ncbi:MAG: hypothetical protein DBX51_03040 [Clostridiales bacterium]|nr:MAG: hypothetical protein DBX51_03040 [Clostridiales bacterium]